MLNTPILFIIFNRFETTKQSFQKIKKAKPKQLFIAADGPRDFIEGEVHICNKTIQYVLQNIDWDCEINTKLEETNIGCKKNVIEAISWFFHHVEKGIILEDDILCTDQFFSFCDELLETYKNDPEIMLISGTNFISPRKFEISESYIFSNYANTWGWATWRRAWDGYDSEILDWEKPEVRLELSLYLKKEEFKFFSNLFDKIDDFKQAWDYQWWFHRFKQKGVGIIPSTNLIKNIGFDQYATHTKDVPERVKNPIMNTFTFPLRHPITKEINTKYDKLISKQGYTIKNISLLNLLKRKVLQIFKSYGKK